jgi:hypothetical protein
MLSLFGVFRRRIRFPMDPIISLAELQSTIHALPPVAPGKVRVFRGQTKNYDKIQPAAYRTHLASRAAWSIYSRFLLADTDRQPGIRRLASQELQIEAVWLEALAQHYGSGSSYLDVSHSVESAAWFALHRGEPTTEDVPIPAAPEWLPQSVQLSWLEYSHALEPGCIYVFDVVEWDPRDFVPPPLALVDLSHAPEVLRTPRMLVQLGCLIRSGDSEHYDLRCHLVCEPLPVAWPMTGSAYVQQRAEEMFPSPAVDPWFRRFLSMPLVPDAGSKGELLLKRPLPVTLYRGETPEYNALVRGTVWFLDPPLVHEVTWQRQPSPDPLKENLVEEVKRATPIVVEAPLMRIFPSADSTLWNHELLISDLPDAAVPINGGKTDGVEKKEAVGLTNVLLQFSALEEIWDRGVPLREANWLTRGLWLSRQQDTCTATLVMQNFPSARLEIQPPVTFRFEPRKRRLIYKQVDGEGEWAELSTFPQLAKPVFVALYLLRALAPTLKAEATPLRYVESSDGTGLRQYSYSVSIFANPAGLVWMPGSVGNADWFALRNMLNDPFTTATSTSSSVKVDTEKDFADFPRSDFQKIIEANKSGFALP